MKDVSNKTIVVLLAVALVITVLGTVVSVNKLSVLGGKFNLLSGASISSSSGVSNLSISQLTSITNNVVAIDFGSGYATAPGPCIIDSNGGMNRTNAYCAGFNNVSSGFLLENTGNIDLSVNYTCTGATCTAASFVGGSSPVFTIWATANSVATQSGETGATDTVATCGGITSLNNTPTAVSTTGRWLCGNSTYYPFNFTDNFDAFVVDLNLSIPSDTPTGGGLKTATFTFSALATG